MSSQTVPFDAEAERAILGALIHRNDMIGIIGGMVSVDDFYLYKNKIIFECIQILDREGNPVDHVTLFGQIRALGKDRVVGGHDAIGDLCDMMTAANCEFYAQRVRRLSVARQMIVAAQEIARDGLTTSTHAEPLAFIASARERLLAIHGENSAIHRPQHIREIVNEVERNVKSDNKQAGLIKTGIAGIDTRSGGLWPGLLTVLAARPGVGKSSLLQTMGTNIARSGHRVLHISLEDLPYVVGIRHVARFADVDNTSIAIGNLTQEELDKIDASLAAARDTNLWVLGASNVTSDVIRSAVLQHREREGLDLLIVDHLAEVREEAENETQAVSKAARAARDLALELRIPVIYAHQLNRKVEDRQDKRPTMSDLKQSGKIEEVARTVWFLYRDGYYTKDPQRHDAQLIISKANHGHTGMVRLWADLSKMYWRDWDDMKDGHFPKQPGVAADGTIDERSPSRTRKAASKADNINWFGNELATPYLDYNEVVDERRDLD